MRIFKLKEFARFARRERIDDATLCKAVGQVQSGAAVADLGGGVFKLRIARRGGGKSRGYRTIVLMRMGELAFFVKGFAKSSQANVPPADLAGYREMADLYLPLENSGLEAMVEDGSIIEIEIKSNGQAVQERKPGRGA